MFGSKLSSIPLGSRGAILRTVARFNSNDPCGSKIDPVNVPGLSVKVLKAPEGKIGPGAKKDGEYKNPEYFSYNKTSYFEAEIEMSKFRLPQPSPYKKD